jgi:hypothetical protein
MAASSLRECGFQDGGVKVMPRPSNRGRALWTRRHNQRAPVIAAWAIEDSRFQATLRLADSRWKALVEASMTAGQYPYPQSIGPRRGLCDLIWDEANRLTFRRCLSSQILFLDDTASHLCSAAGTMTWLARPIEGVRISEHNNPTLAILCQQDQSHSIQMTQSNRYLCSSCTASLRDD